MTGACTSPSYRYLAESVSFAIELSFITFYPLQSYAKHVGFLVVLFLQGCNSKTTIMQQAPATCTRTNDEIQFLNIPTEFMCRNNRNFAAR